MKLLTLQIFSRGKAGLHSELLSFGDHITQLYGPNGSGKTPTVQSIAYCLGYNSIFRDDIYSRCEYARLTFEISGRTYVSSRTFGREFDLTLETDGRVQNFHNEREFSEFLFAILELDADRKLVGLNNAATEPYVSTLLPLYYLDQDNGYNSFYAPPSSFIKDQQSEMMRISFRLPAKHSFDQKKDAIELKKKIEALDLLTNEREMQLSNARAQLGVNGESSKALHEELESLQTQLDGFKASSMTQSESAQAMQQVIKTNLRAMLSIDSELREIELRLAGKRNIVEEINSEINTLSLNEDARRIFMSFDEICSAPQCGMFMKSSNSYGKNLLYLRDQIKDLDRNTELEEDQKKRLLEQRQKLSVEVAELEQSQVIAVSKTESAALVDAISALKNRIFAIQLKLADKRKIEILEARFRESHAQRETSLNAFQELGSESSFSPQLSLVRSEFRKLFIRWLDVLNTPNVNFDITFKQDFIPIFGTETVNQLKGSTKLRTVLAYHAAFIEQMAKIGGSLKIFILDTPKQHDIHNDDLNNFFLALKVMSQEHGVQVIFSSTEYHYVGDGDDAEWNPSFPGKLHSMFFGTDAT
jgi:hypothetical protein